MVDPTTILATGKLLIDAITKANSTSQDVNGLIETFKKATNKKKQDEIISEIESKFSALQKSILDTQTLALQIKAENAELQLENLELKNQNVDLTKDLDFDNSSDVYIHKETKKPYCKVCVEMDNRLRILKEELHSYECQICRDKQRSGFFPKPGYNDFIREVGTVDYND